MTRNWVVTAAIMVVGVVSTSVALLYLWREVASGETWEADDIRASINRGEHLIHAIHQFQKENGRYPTALSELQPNHVTHILPPIAGTRSWRYSTNGTDFFLHFSPSGGYPSWNYDSALGSWYEDS